jgi:hypothetical protein
MPDKTSTWRPGPPPDYSDQFAPKRGSNRRLVCLRCDATFNEVEVVWESRGGDYLWWCPDPKCGGAGIGFDLFEADSDIGRGIIEDVANAKLRETGTCAKLTSHSRSRT